MNKEYAKILRSRGHCNDGQSYHWYEDTRWTKKTMTWRH